MLFQKNMRADSSQRSVVQPDVPKAPAVGTRLQPARIAQHGVAADALVDRRPGRLGVADVRFSVLVAAAGGAQLRAGGAIAAAGASGLCGRRIVCHAWDSGLGLGRCRAQPFSVESDHEPYVRMHTLPVNKKKLLFNGKRTRTYESAREDP
jgi:hypothetical protein